VGCRHSETGGADVVDNVDITLDPAVAAPVRAAARRAKGGVLGAAGAHAGDNIDIAPEATPRAPGRTLTGGGKAGADFVAGCAHCASQIDVALDPAPRAVHGLATNRAKRRYLSATAPLMHHIHITWHATRAAPERLLGASAREIGAFFATHGALDHVFFFFFFFFLVAFCSNGF
jgi:hypothetical protein